MRGAKASVNAAGARPTFQPYVAAYERSYVDRNAAKSSWLPAQSKADVAA
jgi:hypothetical protein